MVIHLGSVILISVVPGCNYNQQTIRQGQQTVAILPVHCLSILPPGPPVNADQIIEIRSPGPTLMPSSRLSLTLFRISILHEDEGSPQEC